MIKRICDFCGEEASNAIGLYSGSTSEKKRDLCRACFFKLEEFLKELGYKNA